MATKIAVKSKPTDANGDRFCPICGEDNGKCYKLWDSKELGYLCAGKIQGNENYWPGVPCKNNFWTYWSKKEDGENYVDYVKKREELAARRLKEKQERARLMLPVPRRNEWFGRLIDSLALSPDDRADLTKRGLTDREIESGLFRSVAPHQPLPQRFPLNLPGVDPVTQTKLLNSGSGYLVPIVNVNCMIVGCQIRLNQSTSEGRYRWLSSSYLSDRGGQGQHTPNGETPLTVRRPVGEFDPSIVGFCEGLGVKPFVAAARFHQVVIGSSGAFWTASPQTLKGSLEILRAEKFHLYPDAGMVLNESVLGGYYSLLKALKETSKPTTIAWWGQAHKLDGDVDEIPEESDMVKLSPKDFWREVERSAAPTYLAMVESVGDRSIKGDPIAIAGHYRKLKSQRRLRHLQIAIPREMDRQGLSWGSPQILGWMERNRMSKESIGKSIGPTEAFYQHLCPAVVDD